MKTTRTSRIYHPLHARGSQPTADRGRTAHGPGEEEGAATLAMR
jgi:hypothetical protein